MKIAEKILGLIFLVSIILRIFDIPGCSILTLISSTFLIGIYFYLGFALFNEIPVKKIFRKDSYSNISTGRLIGAIGLGIGLSTLIVGIVFRLLHYPYAEINLSFGLFISLSAFIIILVKFLKNKSDFYKKSMIRIIIVGGFGLLMFFMSDLTMVKIQYRNNPAYVAAFENFQKDSQNSNNRIIYNVETLRLTHPDEELNFYLETNMQYLRELLTEEEIKYYVNNYKK